MDKISVYSKGGDYFLYENIDGRLFRTPLSKGRYKGTLEKSLYDNSSLCRYYPSFEYYTLHPEYCNLAWVLDDPKDGEYMLIVYDKKAITCRFLSKALTSMEDIQKAVLMGYELWFDNLFYAHVDDNGARHITPFVVERYNLYKRLLEG